MKCHRILIIFILSLVHDSFGSNITKYEGDSTNKFLIRKDPNSLISSRKAGGIRFEDEPQYQDDLSDVSLDEPQPFSFEGSPNQQQPGRITFQDSNDLEDHGYGLSQGEKLQSTQVTFKDDNRIKETGVKKQRRRRRRKPRYQTPGQFPPLPPGSYPPGVPGYIHPSQNLGYPGFAPGQYNPGTNVPFGSYNPGYPTQPYPIGQGFGGGPVGQYRPPRRPKQSFASETLSRVVGALTSIALYDDYQCVPRLLCEAAGGGALGTSPVLQSIAGLQPLLTLLSAYNGISTSPLFVFGRAVFLGMTSKGNTASCRYAYPQCPTDPEQLVHYLNNHNGGFFRFFNSPQPQIPQNVEQFYNQLSGQNGFQSSVPQNYGILDPSSQAPSYNEQGPNQQNYGLYRPHQGPQNPGQLYGNHRPYPQNYPQSPPGLNYGSGFNTQSNYHHIQSNQYGLYRNNKNKHQDPNLHANNFNYSNSGNYGSKYPYDDKTFKDNVENVKIEKRIQNRPSYLYIDSDVGNVDVNSKWIFPENYDNTDVNVVSNNVRGGKNLKFPEDATKSTNDNEYDERKGKSILFPDSDTTKYANYYEYPPISNSNNYHISYQNYKIGSGGNTNYNKYNSDYAYSDKLENIYNKYNSNFNSHRYSKYMYANDEEDGVQTVYILRGNGDPNNPEIVKIRPGEKLMI